MCSTAGVHHYTSGGRVEKPDDFSLTLQPRDLSWEQYFYYLRHNVKMAVGVGFTTALLEAAALPAPRGDLPTPSLGPHSTGYCSGRMEVALEQVRDGSGQTVVVMQAWNTVLLYDLPLAKEHHEAVGLSPVPPWRSGYSHESRPPKIDGRLVEPKRAV
ncbi:hypothetical protein J0S82_020095 [Galemys pyrenaicus]|uniref:Uncharacterized protein n=1 Tax=Galemys pyrenaicus TaxID=202257 RepID=A0A8J6DGR6_GALPY|nr:hypothetical protein J0S82_020095 [Galemys pyrenaicus]